MGDCRRVVPCERKKAALASGLSLGRKRPIRATQQSLAAMHNMIQFPMVGNTVVCGIFAFQRTGIRSRDLGRQTRASMPLQRGRRHKPSGSVESG